MCLLPVLANFAYGTYTTLVVHVSLQVSTCFTAGKQPPNQYGCLFVSIKPIKSAGGEQRAGPCGTTALWNPEVLPKTDEESEIERSA